MSAAPGDLVQDSIRMGGHRGVYKSRCVGSRRVLAEFIPCTVGSWEYDCTFNFFRLSCLVCVRIFLPSVYKWSSRRWDENEGVGCSMGKQEVLPKSEETCLLSPSLYVDGARSEVKQQQGDIAKRSFRRICVFCGSSRGKKDIFSDVAFKLGRELVGVSFPGYPSTSLKILIYLFRVTIM